MFQSLGGGTDKSGGEGRVISFHHGIPRYSNAVRVASVGQFTEMGHHIRHREGRVWIQGDGGDLELLVAKARSVECLESARGGKRTEERVEARHTQ